MTKCTTNTYYAGCTSEDKTTCCFECKDKKTCGFPCLFKPAGCAFAKAESVVPEEKPNMVKSDESEEALMMCGRDFESRPDGAYVEEGTKKMGVEIKTTLKIDYEDKNYKELAECLQQIAVLTKRALELDFEIKTSALLNRVKGNSEAQCL